MSKASRQDSSSNDSSRNATDLIDRYLQAVRFWVPKTNRQEDLLSELGEDLRSQFDDKETELGRPLDKAEMAAILKRCGSPMMVAARIGPQRHLIGPALFPIYGFVLKMVLLWIQVPLFVFIIGPVNLAYSGGDWGSAVLNTFGTLWSALFIAAAIITLVFPFFERPSPHLVAAPAEISVSDSWSGGGVSESRTDSPHVLSSACFAQCYWPGEVRHHAGAAAVDVVPAPQPVTSVGTYADPAELHDRGAHEGARRVPVPGPAGWGRARCAAGFAKILQNRRHRERVDPDQRWRHMAGSLHCRDRTDLGVPTISAEADLRRLGDRVHRRALMLCGGGTLARLPAAPQSKRAGEPSSPLPGAPKKQAARMPRSTQARFTSALAIRSEYENAVCRGRGRRARRA